MSSLNQLISEIAHSVQQADSVPVKRALRQAIIHARNELIRHSYSNHNYVDKVLKQRFNLSLISVPDGDIKNVPNIDDPETENVETYPNIKRTDNLVPRPVRFTNNLPFHTVKLIGGINTKIIPHVSEGATQYYRYLPGMSCSPSYDYINGYIYVYNIDSDITKISVESVFEYPHEISLEFSDELYEGTDYTKPKIIFNDDDEFFLPEDLVNAVKKLTLETFNGQIVRDTNEIPTPNLLK